MKARYYYMQSDDVRAPVDASELEALFFDQRRYSNQRRRR